MLKGIHQQLHPHDTPAFFVQGPKPFSRLMVFCALSLVMMAIDARFDYLSQVRQAFSAALHPLEVIARAPNQWGRNIDRYFTAHNRLIKENTTLKQQALIDHAALQRLTTLHLENQHLRSLLKGDQARTPDAILGEVLHMGRDPFSNILTINRGSRDKIVAGQAVVDGEGVVGQITRVYPYTSEVTLITDKKLSIPIQIERNQLRAIAFGEGKRNTLDIPYLPTSVDIKVGDKLVTSGIDGVYPAGLAVAQVTHIKQSQDSPFAKIISRPIAGVNNHKHVLILALPETAPSVSVVETRPAMPRNSTQQLDQAVVDILQQANAKMDPMPPSKATPAVVGVSTDEAANPERPPQANATEDNPPSQHNAPANTASAIGNGALAANPVVANPSALKTITQPSSATNAPAAANTPSPANVAEPSTTATHRPTRPTNPAAANTTHSSTHQPVATPHSTLPTTVPPARPSATGDARGSQRP